MVEGVKRYINSTIQFNYKAKTTKESSSPEFSKSDIGLSYREHQFMLRLSISAVKSMRPALVQAEIETDRQTYIQTDRPIPRPRPRQGGRKMDRKTD